MRAGGRGSKAHVTLARVLSKFGHASRSVAAGLIRDGRVTVDGRTVTDPGHWLDPRGARITVDGKRLAAVQQHVYLAMHKPAGYVTTRADERGRATVYDLLPEKLPWVFPVGRLDRETSGLLLFTNDQQWGEMISGPDHGVPKTYRVVTDHPIAAEDLRDMEQGMTLSDGTVLLPVRSDRADGDERTFRLTLTEGKNRQVRRMMEQHGYRVVRLERMAIGPILLGGLREGAVRTVTEKEQEALMRMAEGAVR